MWSDSSVRIVSGRLGKASKGHRLPGRSELVYCESSAGSGRVIGRRFGNTEQLQCMPNEFDPYREALVMEEVTVWPDEYDDWEMDDRTRVERALHAEPKNCAELTYVRQHTGFRRQITVTEADLERLAAR